MVKYLYITFGILFICLLGTCIYFVGGVSATSPPIKTYDYIGNKEQFEAGLKRFLTKNHNIKYKYDDTVGDSKNGFAYDFSITDSVTNATAGIRYEEYNDSDVKKVKVKLFSIFNNSTHEGGYGIKADGMKELLSNFNKYFVVPLQQQSNVQLTEMPKEFSLY